MPYRTPGFLQGGTLNPDSVPVTPVGYFPRLLSTAAHVSNQAANAALARFSLDREKVAVLTSMAHGSRAADALLAEAHVSGPRMGTILASLRESGYARQDPESGHWSATPSGVTMIERARAVEMELASEAEKDRQLRAALQTLIATLQDGEDAPGPDSFGGVPESGSSRN